MTVLSLNFYINILHFLLVSHNAEPRAECISFLFLVEVENTEHITESATEIVPANKQIKWNKARLPEFHMLLHCSNNNLDFNR